MGEEEEEDDDDDEDAGDEEVSHDVKAPVVVTIGKLRRTMRKR